VESCRCDCGADRSAPAQRLDAIGRAFMPRDDRSVLDHHTLKSAPWRGLPYLSVPIVKEPHWPSSLPEICLMRPSLLTWQHGGGSFSRQPHRASGHRSGRPPSHAGRARHLECATLAATIQGRTVGSSFPCFVDITPVMCGGSSAPPPSAPQTDGARHLVTGLNRSLPSHL
jgi:hypothetical protein